MGRENNQAVQRLVAEGSPELMPDSAVDGCGGHPTMPSLFRYVRAVGIGSDSPRALPSIASLAARFLYFPRTSITLRAAVAFAHSFLVVTDQIACFAWPGKITALAHTFDCTHTALALERHCNGVSAQAHPPELQKLFPEPLLYLYTEAKGESVTEKAVTFRT